MLSGLPRGARFYFLRLLVVEIDTVRSQRGLINSIRQIIGDRRPLSHSGSGRNELHQSAASSRGNTGKKMSFLHRFANFFSRDRSSAFVENVVSQ